MMDANIPPEVGILCALGFVLGITVLGLVLNLLNRKSAHRGDGDEE